MNVAVQSACVMMCATELCNETPDIKLLKSCLQTFAGNLSHHSDASGDKNCNYLCWHTFIICVHNKWKITQISSPPSSGNIVPV